MKRWLPFAAWCAFLGYVVWSADTGGMRWFFDWYEGLHPLADKAGHIGLIGMFTFLFDRALAGRTVTRAAIPIAPLIIFAVMTVEEFSQLRLPSRTFDLTDLAANYAGILLAVLAARVFRKNPRREHFQRL